MTTLSTRLRTAALLVLTFSVSLHAKAPLEQELKAAYVYNFASFTDWDGDTSGNLNLCLFGQDALHDALQGLNGKAVRQRRIVFNNPHTVEQARNCNVLFIGSEERDRLPRVVDQAAQMGTLTISDHVDARKLGVMILIGEDQNHLEFEVNLSAARHARINFSSKLLRLAKNVY